MVNGCLLYTSPLRELIQAAGLEDLTESTFKRALKPFLGAFVPTVSPGTRTVSNDDGESEAMEGLIATCLLYTSRCV